MSARAIDIHVAERDVMKDARWIDGVAQTRVAGRIAAGSVLCRSERIVSWIRVSLAAPGTLIDERLDSRHYRRGNRRSTVSGPGIRSTRARDAPIIWIRITDYVVVSPQSVRGEQRDVGNVSHSIGGIANNRLPPGLAVTGAASAHDIAGGWRSRSAAARSSASRCGG